MKNKTLLEEQLRVSLERNDPESIGLAYQLYRRDIHAFLWFKTKNNEESKDLCQETFVRAKRAFESGRYRHVGKTLGWLIQIANNLFLDTKRRSKKFGRNERLQGLDEDPYISTLVSPDEAWISLCVSGEVTESVRHLLGKLPKEQKEVVFMRMYFGMSFKEIAEYQEVSINTSLGRMRYALINLRKIVKARNLDLEGLQMAS